SCFIGISRAPTSAHRATRLSPRAPRTLGPTREAPRPVAAAAVAVDKHRERIRSTTRAQPSQEAHKHRAGASVVSQLAAKLPTYLERAYPEFLRETWRAWRAFLWALFGLPLDDEAHALFTAHTGRQMPPTQQSREAWLVIGRRGGKSRIVSLLAVFL